MLHEGESRVLFGMDGSGQGVVYIATNGVGSLMGKFNQYLETLSYTQLVHFGTFAVKGCLKPRGLSLNRGGRKQFTIPLVLGLYEILFTVVF